MMRLGNLSLSTVVNIFFSAEMILGLEPRQPTFGNREIISMCLIFFNSIFSYFLHNILINTPDSIFSAGNISVMLTASRAVPFSCRIRFLTMFVTGPVMLYSGRHIAERFYHGALLQLFTLFLLIWFSTFVCVVLHCYSKVQVEG